jgi:hypothetical protein
MRAMEDGRGPLFQIPDPDGTGAFFLAKNRSMVDKRTTAKEAVRGRVPNGGFLAFSGFGTNRIPSEILHEAGVPDAGPRRLPRFTSPPDPMKGREESRPGRGWTPRDRTRAP